MVTDPRLSPGRGWRVAGAVAAVVAAAACVALGVLDLGARQSLHDVYETRFYSGTLHLHYALIRRLVLLVAAGTVVATIGACVTMRHWKLVAIVALLAATVALVVFGLQQSPAAFVGAPRPHVTYVVGNGLIFPGPERRELHFAALLAFAAAAACALAAFTTARAPASSRSRAAPDPHAHTS